jgi:drug/metabolite transporter (DMT)-like permease
MCLSMAEDAVWTAPMAPREMLELAAVALMWGGSFLLIDIAVEDLSPEMVAALRLAFGAALLGLLPAARVRVERGAWRPIGALAVVWMAAPFILFAVALRSIDSSVAGMLNGAAPLCTAVVAAIAFGTRPTLPTLRQGLGLAVGFGGVVAIAWPQVGGARAEPVGVALVVVAVALYGVAFNLTGSLQRRHGALPTILRAELVALALVAPAALASVGDCRVGVQSLVAVAVLGAVSTGAAFALFSRLAGGIGAVRASVVTYLLPGIALALGVLVRGEQVAPIAVAGGALVVAGAWVVGRRG